MPIESIQPTDIKQCDCKCPAGKCEPESNEGTFCWRSGFFIPTGEFQDEESSLLRELDK